MKALIPILLSFFCSTLSFSQKHITLEPQLIDIDPSFYIADVVYDEKDASIGTVKTSSEEKTRFYLKDGVATSVKNFMNIALPEKDGKMPIKLKIEVLEIQQMKSSISQITARAYVKVAFITDGEFPFTIAHFEDNVFSSGEFEAIQNSHKKRIAAALEYCVLQFHAKTKADTDLNDGDSYSKNAHPPALRSDVRLGKWFDIFSFKKTFSKNYDGWKVGYVGFADSNSKFIIPFELSFGQTKAKTDIVQQRGYSSLDSYTFSFGFNGYIKLTPGIYFELGLNAPIGAEVLRDLENKKSHNFLIGLNSNQGIKIIPWKNFGVVIGIGISESIQTSKVYKTNFGVIAELGINL